MAHETISLSALVSNEKIYLIPVNISDLEIITEEIGTDLFEIYEFDYLDENGHLKGIPLNAESLFYLISNFNVLIEGASSQVMDQWRLHNPFGQWTEKHA